MSTFLLFFSAQAASLTVQSAPDAVVVFADRARVTREASVNLAAGRQEVVFENLPTSMFQEGITADAQGGATLRGIDLKAVTATEAADRRVKEIDAEIAKLSLESQAWSDEVRAYQLEINALDAARVQAAQQLSAQMLVASDAPEQASRLRNSLAAQDTAARNAIRAADIKRRDIDEKINALRRERNDLGSSATDTWTVIVHLDVERAGRIEVDLSYLVSGASWSPRYDIRGDADTGKVEVALSAMVQQTSGEDWSDVKLSVSSAQPNLGTIVPVLDPFWLQRYVPVPMPTMAPATRAMTKAEAPMPAPMAPPPAEDIPMQVAQATVNTQLAATTFIVERPEDISADGTERKVLLTTQRLDAKLRYVVVPRLDLRVYLVGELVNSAEFPLLSGTAGIFLAGNYLGDMSLQTIAPGEKFDVAFGVDDAVTARRIPKEVNGGQPALVGKRASSRWDWEVKVRNGHKRAINVVIKEQIPVSTRDDVTVSLRPSTVTPQTQEGGLLDFGLTIQAGAEAALKWGYDVDYPSELSLRWME